MARLTAFLLAFVLAVAACGGDETADSSSDGSDSAATQTGQDDADAASTDDQDDTTGDGQDTEGQETAGQETSGQDTTDDDPTDQDGAGGERMVLTSVDDLPEQCRELFADYLRDIEPLVQDIDWSTAATGDIMPVVGQFQTLSDNFDAQVAGIDECANIDLDNTDLSVTLEFAREVAPGTVQFLEFVDSFGVGGGTPSTPGAAGGSGFADCAEAVAFVEELVAQYDSMNDIPLTDLTRIQEVGTVMTTCSAEESAALQSALEAFFP